MALDTETKRRASLGLGRGHAVAGPVADGAVEPADRLHFLGGPSRSLLAFSWANGTLLKMTERGTELTTAGLPPGSWIVMIKSVDTSGNYSGEAAAVSVTVANTFDVVQSPAQAPRWPGTRTGFVKHDVSGTLVPDSNSLADATGYDVFDQFVTDPVDECIYEAPEIDLGFDADTVRVWATMGGALGPGEVAGFVNPELEIDYKDAADSYDGFEDWTVGTVDARTIKARLVMQTADGLGTIDTFTPTADVEERTESDKDVAISGGGTAIAFDQRFHVKPAVTVTADATSGLIAVKSSVSVTGFTAQVFDTGGSDVGGTVDWSAVGA